MPRIIIQNSEEYSQLFIAVNSYEYMPLLY